LDIAEHLALHDSAIKGWVYNNVRTVEFRQDAYQNIVLFMVEVHERGWYDHDRDDEAELFTYAFPYLRGVAFEGIHSEWFNENVSPEIGGKPGLVLLEEIAAADKEAAPRDAFHLYKLYDEPFPLPGEGPPESTLTPEEQAIAEKLGRNLPDEDLERLFVSYDHTERQGAAYFGEPKSTYRYRLEQARERAKTLLRLWGESNLLARLQK
jgi:hypothetical protein